jgi:hypothetical protein
MCDAARPSGHEEHLPRMRYATVVGQLLARLLNIIGPDAAALVRAKSVVGQSLIALRIRPRNLVRSKERRALALLGRYHENVARDLGHLFTPALGTLRL